MKNRRRKEDARAKLVDSTSSLIISFVYMLTICWVAPVVPMIITWIFDLSFTSFMVIWATGLPLLSLAWYYFLKKSDEDQLKG